MRTTLCWLLPVLSLTGPVAASPPTDLAGLRVSLALHAPWGSDPGQLGRSRPREANPQCPMSLAVDRAGTVHVLDQVNFRVVAFEPGGAGWSLDLPSDTFQDLALDGTGRTLLLDRLVSASVWYLDHAGRPLGEVALAGPGIEEPGGVTGLFPGPDGLWVEYDNGLHVRLADPEGRPDRERPTRLGRPTGDGRLVLAAITGPRSVTLFVQPPSARERRRLSTLSFPMSVFRIDGLDSDAQGRIWLAVDLAEEAPEPPYGVVRESAQVVVVSPGGEELQRLELPPLDAPEEQLRPVKLGADGALYQLRCQPDGAAVRRIAR